MGNLKYHQQMFTVIGDSGYMVGIITIGRLHKRPQKTLTFLIFLGEMCKKFFWMIFYRQLDFD